MTSKSMRDAQELKTVTLEWDAKFQRIAKLPTAVEQALAYKKLGLSPVPLRPGNKLPTCKAHPALSVIQLSDDDIERLFKKRGVGVGMVGGFGGYFSIDNDETDPAKCDEIERLQCELLSVPYARWKGRKGYKALYQDSRWNEPSLDLTKAARDYFECGLDLSEAERNREPPPKLEKEFTELKAVFDEKLDAFIQSNRLVPTVGKPIEIKSFRLITVLPPSLHPETGEAYQVTPIAAGHHAAGLDGNDEAFAIAAEDVNRFLDTLRPDDAKGRKQGGRPLGRAAYVDYTRRGYSEAWQAIALDDVLKHKPDLAEFSDAEYVEDRSPAIPSLLGKLVQGMMQVRECDADKLGVFTDVAKQLAELGDEFIERFPNQTKAVAGSIEDHGKPWQEKLGYEAGRALESAMATDFNIYIPGREPREGDTPTIYIRAGEQHLQVQEAQRRLVEAGVPFYQRGGALVRPVMEEMKDALGKPTKTAAFAEIDVAYMRHALNAHIQWMKHDGRSKAEWQTCNAPEDVARTLLALRGEWVFPPVSGILSAPTLRPDGSLLDKTGYDEATGLYLLNSIELPPMQEKPAKAVAAAALARLRKLYAEFPFVDEASESVALSEVLTVVTRGMTDVVPAHGTRAPAAGSGKSYKSDITSVIATGHRCPVIAAGATPEETEKRLAAKAMTGAPIIAVDNINGMLGGDALCQLIERPICELRILGKSEMVKIVNRATVLFNGNNCRVTGDMTRRVLMCELDHGLEQPSEKKFKGNPVADAMKNRAQYLADCLTIVRAYVVAGRPEVVNKPMNSFQAWSSSVRSALVWLGMADPCDTVRVVRQDDPETQQLARFLSVVADAMGTEWNKRWTVAELATAATATVQRGNGLQHPELEEVLAEFTGRNGVVDRKRLSNWLSGKQHRILGGLEIAGKMDAKIKTWRWCVSRVE